jgi:integrase
MKLTQAAISGLALPEGKADVIFFDDDMPGLGLRLRKGIAGSAGKRSWIYQYQLGSKQRRMTIGIAPALTLAAARKTAGDLHARVRLGEDPATARDEKRRQASDTVEAMLKPYLAEKRPTLSPRTIPEIERHLLVYAKPLHSLAVAAITRRDVSTLSAELATSIGNATANLTRTSLSGFFSWCVTKGLIEENPVRGSHRTAGKPRERVLTVPELVEVWHALDRVQICNGAYAAIVRTLILTGQRRDEIGGLEFAELRDDLDRIDLPPRRTKPKRSHTIPLSDPVRAILRPWIDRTTDSPFVFGPHPFVSWSLGKRMLDEALVKAGIEIEPCVVHDLRRSAATGMGNINVAPHVIEAVLNHSGAKADILAGIDPRLRRTYNQSVYENPKRDALVAWGDHVMAAVEGRSAAVVPFRAA